MLIGHISQSSHCLIVKDPKQGMPGVIKQILPGFQFSFPEKIRINGIQIFKGEHISVNRRAL
jgi:hypothetical protein